MTGSLFAKLCAFVAFAMLLGACAAKEDNVQENDMTVVVDFRDVHRCSRISPEITVTNAPQGTRFFDVRLIEGREKDRFLGGGMWRADGTGVIPEGALTRHYTGPCPQAGKPTVYTYVVSAMREEDGQPLEVRLCRIDLE